MAVVYRNMFVFLVLLEKKEIFLYVIAGDNFGRRRIVQPVVGGQNKIYFSLYDIYAAVRSGGADRNIGGFFR